MAEKKITVSFCTLGCRVNQYETRAVQEEFVNLGFEVLPFSDKCDAYVINTCTVTAESDRKSRQMIRRAAKSGQGDAVIAVMGCMSQISPEQTAKIDGVDIVLGNTDKTSCASLVKEAIEKKRGRQNAVPALCMVEDIFKQTQIEDMSVTGSDNTRAFVKIVDGCENNCSYCIIPSARGKIRSKSIEKVTRECENITKIAKSREIVLTGIETAAFGKDNGQDLCDLAKSVANVKDVARIRFGSLEPTVIKEDFAKSLSQNPKFMPHFHLSLQSGCDDVLGAMKRKYNTTMFLRKLEILRKYFGENLEITTDIIVGFPRETKEQFEETARFVEKCAFLYVHIFPYSDRKGTKASMLCGKISEDEKKQRAAILNEIMKRTRRKVLEKYIGKTFPVLCETQKNGFMHGYTPNFIEVRFKAKDLLPNDIVNVKLESIDKDIEFVFGEIVKD